MSIPGNAEPGAFSGQQQVRLQQSIHLSSAIPIKKRRFPVIQPESPPLEEKRSNSEVDDSQNKRESNVPEEELSLGDARNTASPGNSNVNKNSAFVVKKEATPTNIEFGKANAHIFASEPLEAKPPVGVGTIDNLRNKMDGLSNEKSAEPVVPEIGTSSQTANVKRETVFEQAEGACKVQLSASPMNVELSLGPKEPLLSALESQNSEAITHKSEKSDPSLLSLALAKQNLDLHRNKDSALDNVSSQVYSNRSNWDLNTTMDVWEGSSNSDPSHPKLVDIGGFNKADSSGEVKSSLTTAGTVGSLDIGKHISGDHRSNSSNGSLQSHHLGKTDISLGLRLSVPNKELGASMGRYPLSDKSVPASVNPRFKMQPVQSSSVSANRTVKSEPVDENLNQDCSIGSCSSSNMGLTNSSVKRESVSNGSLETALQPSVSPGKLIGHRSIKSEVVEECNQEACKSTNGLPPQSAARIIQHQDSCASSSSLSVSLMSQNSFPSRLPTCSELATNGDLSNQSEHSFHGKEFYDHNDIQDEHIASMVPKAGSKDDKHLNFYKSGNSNLEDPGKCKCARDDDHTLELCQSGEVAANDDEKTNISAAMCEGASFGSNCESKENCAIETPKAIEENVGDREDEEYEDGEVRDTLRQLAGDPIVEGKETKNLEHIDSEPQNLEPSVLLGDQSINAPDFEEKGTTKENHDEIRSDTIKDCASISCEPHSENDSWHKASDKVLEVRVIEKRSICVSPEKQPDVSGRKDDVEIGTAGKVSSDEPTNGSRSMDNELCHEATDKVVKEVCSGENDSNVSKVEVPLNGHSTAKVSNTAGNKSRIINLSRTSDVTTPGKARPIPNRLLTSRSGKGRYSDFDGEIQPRVNRNKIYTGGPNKFAKDRVHDQSVRNSRTSFMSGKGRIPGRFGSLHSEWDCGQDFAPETYNGPPSNYRVMRRKHASNVSDFELECNGYGIPQDGTALFGGRRKAINDEFPSLRRSSLRRLSPGDKDGNVTRGIQMLHRIPRNVSPSGCNIEDGSDVIGLQHSDKFMRHLSDDIIDPAYGRPQAMYDNPDGQPVRGDRNFSTLHRKGYPRIRSKSPVGSRTRAPGPWHSPRRRSPNGPPELIQHRSLYRTGRVRSPDRACFRDEIVARRHESPSYVALHSNELRDLDSGREHVHPRSANSHRRTSPAQVFSRSTRRAETLDSHETGDGDEYINGPLLPNNFHELRGDESIDERRKFIERRGPLRTFRPNSRGENDNFHFHQNDGPRPYRFCPDVDAEFVERSNMREREFDGRARRTRNIEEPQDGNYRPMERVWHNDGFTDARVKRRRF